MSAKTPEEDVDGDVEDEDDDDFVDNTYEEDDAEEFSTLPQTQNKGCSFIPISQWITIRITSRKSTMVAMARRQPILTQVIIIQ